MTTDNAHSDLLIIGSGAAGLYAADRAAADGARVTLVTADQLASGSSYWSQGGIAAVTTADDDFASHAADTRAAGRGYCKDEAVTVLVREGAAIANDLIERGMPFDRHESGSLQRGLEGGHSHHRVLHALGVQTGKALVDFLIGQVRERANLTVIENAFAYRLLTDASGHCGGAMLYRWQHGDNLTLTANATVLATGGYSALFARSTNPHTSAGDGLALAANAGATLSDMAFVQFHPTAFYSASGPCFLLSEALRGAGATLVDAHGRRFLADRDSAELAPRDVVARAIFQQIEYQEQPFVGLDLRHLDPTHLTAGFDYLLKQVATQGVDSTREPIPVAPAAHYCIGGVATDLDGHTGVPGLYACGEVAATGVHGANRLASNSLLECLVFGQRTARHALHDRSPRQRPTPGNGCMMYVDSGRAQDFIARRRDLADLLTAQAGLVRDADGLQYALDALDQASSESQTKPVRTGTEYYDCRTRYMYQIARTVVSSALHRPSSIGVHYRCDELANNRHVDTTI
ncbi:L-aspartate oxidase [Salinisphaera sp. USBA-960]|nr:L-aspartate oxidase [Salifodinibacter halophilus]NNC26877.1 L-aspartate oxidase [Salifodinibacter halophilus]